MSLSVLLAVLPAVLLASASPRRRELLAAAGVDVRVYATDCDERVRDGEPAPVYAARVAADKLAVALARCDPAARAGRAVLAADTVVWLDDDDPAPIGKPVSRADAAAIVSRLFSDRTHRVTTAWALARVDGAVEHGASTTLVTMRRPLPGELSRYLDAGDWHDKAGAYAIQGAAAGIVTRIEGSYTNVVGLPLAEVLAALHRGAEAP